MRLVPRFAGGKAWRDCLGLVVGVVLTAAACSPEDSQRVPGPFRVGVLPDRSEETLRQKYAPLLGHLARTLGHEFELVIPRDYPHLLELFGNQDVDMAYFGGVTFLAAHEEFSAVPLAMRDVDVNFTTSFLARTGEPNRMPLDFAGKRLAFGAKLSTSGHIMPRYFLRKMGVDPERFFADVHYSGAHDRSALLVQEGGVDLAAVNSAIVEDLIRTGRLDPDRVGIVWESPPYPDYVWAVQPETEDDFRSRLLDAFLELSPDTNRDMAILGALGAGGFLPASLAEFAEVQDAIAQLP